MVPLRPARPGFAHIIEKAWQYSISVHDGKLAASTPYAGYRSYEYSTGYDLAVGNSSSSAFDIPCRGLVDAARVSRSIRTPAEIAAVWAGIAKRIR